jgi:hypothetical protein
VTKVWKLRDNATAPVEIECAAPGYPNLDAAGDIIYSNTHFTDEATAWARLRDDRNAHLRRASTDVRKARASLARHEGQLVEAALLLEEFERRADERQQRRRGE